MKKIDKRTKPFRQPHDRDGSRRLRRALVKRTAGQSPADLEKPRRDLGLDNEHLADPNKPHHCARCGKYLYVYPKEKCVR